MRRSTLFIIWAQYCAVCQLAYSSDLSSSAENISSDTTFDVAVDPRGTRHDLGGSSDSKFPIDQPTDQPSLPTTIPSPQPTYRPTSHPSSLPIPRPTPYPSPAPTRNKPSPLPTAALEPLKSSWCDVHNSSSVENSGSAVLQFRKHICLRALREKTTRSSMLIDWDPPPLRPKWWVERAAEKAANARLTNHDRGSCNNTRGFIEMISEYGQARPFTFVFSLNVLKTCDVTFHPCFRRATF